MYIYVYHKTEKRFSCSQQYLRELYNLKNYGPHKPNPPIKPIQVV